MKLLKLIIKKLSIILLLIPLISEAQLNAEFGGGIETKNEKPIAKISINYVRSNIILGTSMWVTSSRVVNSSNYFGVKTGFEIHSFVATIGYYYNYKNADDKIMNHMAGAGYSLKYLYNIVPYGGLYMEIVYVEKIFLITTGFHCRF